MSQDPVVMTTPFPLAQTHANDTMPSCTCRDWITWNIPCKHFFSVFRFYPLWDWNKLPDSYRDSAYLSTDTSSLNTFFDDTTGSEVEKISQEEPEPVEEEEHSQDEIPKLQVL